MWFLRTVEQHRVNKEKDEVVGIQIRAVIEEIEWDQQLILFCHL
jgi:hypothetical protein